MADEEILGQMAVRDAINLLREYGVTPEQYAMWNTEGKWSVLGRGNFPTREAAFADAQAFADERGEWAEVWREWVDGAAAESWIVKP